MYLQRGILYVCVAYVCVVVLACICSYDLLAHGRSVVGVQ